ncbi:hypothetical protein ACOMHN_013332 [Nucella lapillus]
MPATDALMTKLEGSMEQLIARIEALEREEWHQRQPRGQLVSRNRYRCQTCIQLNNRRCRHCWRCGNGSHFERDCTPIPNRDNQGNGLMSRRGGRQ